LSPCRTLHGDRRGVAAVEFALVASMFLSLVLGSIALGLLWWTQNALEMTAALTARCAALGPCPDDSTVTAYANSVADNWVVSNILAGATVTTNRASSCYAGASGKYIGYTQVTISIPYWSDVFIGPFANTVLSVSACYPNPA
jgi:Flp pilus assembly protein TadG